MKIRIPFLDLAPMHRELSKSLGFKFSELLQKGIFSGGEEVDIFESKMSNLLKSPFAISCANGSDAIELALRVLGIGMGDEVLVPALTWVSTAESVVLTGAKPVFVDVDENGLIDLDLLQGLDSPRIKAVIPVHLYGKMVKMPILKQLAELKRWWVIEDAAQAFGASMDGQPAGGFGEMGCFSFYPTKNLGALGEAGMVTTYRKDLADKLLHLRNHGQAQRDHHEIVGRNSRIDTLQAAFLNVKLDHFKAWQEKRKDLAKDYLYGLKDVPGIKLPQGILDVSHNAHIFQIQTENRDRIQKHLFKFGIGTAIHYPKTVPSTPAFGKLQGYPVAERLADTSLSLPLHPYMRQDDIAYISQVLTSYLNKVGGI
ncbi:DegT/DnrJ/EryC1/StrS family aminotransferase [Pararhodonellum marinum]|uniref:DegT/DnrJ/EryC1/StrS family aminotransferase n=1 Tax=Pararhodonellum marinum TaxID=2755358 RepID=UPI0018905E81|nr:DegT/DnrJ/EryC1/StrS family aminotransferase [Pararhodonellum marinum]